VIKVTVPFLLSTYLYAKTAIAINRILRILFYLAGFIFLLHSAYPHFHDAAGRLSPELNKETKPSADWLAILLNTDLGEGHLEYAPHQLGQLHDSDISPTDSYLPVLPVLSNLFQLKLVKEAIVPPPSFTRFLPPSVYVCLPLGMRAPPFHV